MSNVTATQDREVRAADVPEWASLSEDEDVLWSGKPALDPYILEAKETVIPTGVFGGAAIFGLAMMNYGGALSEPGMAVFLMGSTIAAFGVIATISNFLDRFGRDYLITTEDVYQKRGIFSRNVRNVSLGDVQKTSLEQSWLGRKRSYGTVKIGTAATGASEVALLNVRHPDDVVEMLNDLSKN